MDFTIDLTKLTKIYRDEPNSARNSLSQCHTVNRTSSSAADATIISILESFS